MNLKFKSELSGSQLFKKSLAILIGYIIAVIAFMSVISNGPEAILAMIVLYALVLLGAFALNYIFMVALVNSVSFKDENFTWGGSFGQYMLLNIKGIFLSLITVGIYGAWYSKNITDYMANNTIYPGKEIKFNGQAPKLLKYIILSFVLPLIVVIGLFTGIMAVGESIPILILGFIIYILGLFSVLAVYYYYMYKWYIDFNFGEDQVILVGNPKDTIVFMVKQFLLIIITLGIYSFAAEVKIFAYFTDHVVFIDKELRNRSLHFTGVTFEGFKLFLGQYLLTIITIGIYGPWAYAKTMNWLISNVELLESDIQPVQ